MATITVRELSEELDTTPRVARKFLRAVTDKDEQPGKGGRWEIQRGQLRSLRKKFDAFQKEHMRQAGEDQTTQEHDDEVDEDTIPMA